jgi:glycerophosphoryl diester phosphodiesterase
MTASRPLVVADRGASADAPEHTIAAFELALDQGADGIALDVHLARDGQPIVIHDFTLERTTSGAGVVHAHTTRELKRLDAGAWGDARFRGQRIQTLQEVLERFRERTRFAITIKGGVDVYPGVDERVVSALEVYDVVDKSLVLSADPATLDRVRSLNADVRLAGAAIGRLDPHVLSRFGPVEAICVDETQLRDEGGRMDISKIGIGCYVRVRNATVERVERWLTSDVTGIVTDRPSLARTRPGR